MERLHDASYKSKKFNSHLYKRLKFLNDTISEAIHDEETLPKFDNLMYFNGIPSDDYLQQAQNDYLIYSANITALMASYGIQCEGELFAGSFSTLRNKLSEREHDDMSFYNTTRTIEQRLIGIFGAARQRFFGEYFELATEKLHKSKFHTENKDLQKYFNHVCLTDPPEYLKKLASAYYAYCYENTTKAYMSFAWVAWDVLEHVHRTNKQTFPHLITMDPIGDALTRNITTYIDDNFEDFSYFHERYISTDFMLLKEYVEKNAHLDMLMYYVVKWAEKYGIFVNEGLRREHFCLLLIRCGLGEYKPIWPEQQIWLPPLEESDMVNLWAQHRIGGIGRIFMDFIRFLASKKFKEIKFFDFNELDKSFFFQKEWWIIHEKAVRTYYKLVFLDDSTHLPNSEDINNSTNNLGAISNYDKEILERKYIIECPKQSISKLIMRESKDANSYQSQTTCSFIDQALRKYSKCRKVSMRLKFPEDWNLTENKLCKIIVHVVGNRKSLEIFEDLFSAVPDLKLSEGPNMQLKIRVIIQNVIDRIIKISDDYKREIVQQLV